MVSNAGSDTSNAAPLFCTELRGSVLLAVLDMPGRTMNVFSWRLMDELEALMERVETTTAIKALVLTSGKDSFLAGADLEMVRGFMYMGKTASRATLREITGRLGRLFNRLEEMPKPSVAAVNGLALGGGLEIAMACHYRVVADDPRLQLGVPEIKLGLLPGAGGTQRMPRLIGIERGLELLLSGKSLTPADAKVAGLVDEIVPLARLVDRAIAVATELSGKLAASRMPKKLDPGPFDAKAKDAVRRITRHFGYDDATVAQYPAYDAIVRATLDGAEMPVRDGGEQESARFIDLMQDSVAGNMVAILFLGRQKADKLVAQLPAPIGLRFAVSASGKAAEALKAALTAAKVTVVAASEVTEGDIVIGRGAGTGDLQLLEHEGDRLSRGVGVYVRRSKPYGTAIEIVIASEDETATAQAMVLAQRLRASPYIHTGTLSLLARMAHIEARAAAAGLPEDAKMAAQALEAERLRAAGGIGDPLMADVACAVSGVFPAYAGGPFTFLAQCPAGRLAEIRAHSEQIAPDLFG